MAQGRVEEKRDPNVEKSHRNKKNVDHVVGIHSLNPLRGVVVPELPVPPLMGATDVSRHLRERRTCARAHRRRVPHPMKTVRTKCRTPARSSLVLDHRLSGSTGARRAGRGVYRARRTAGHGRRTPPCPVLPPAPSSHAQDTRPAGVIAAATSAAVGVGRNASSSRSSTWVT